MSASESEAGTKTGCCAYRLSGAVRVICIVSRTPSIAERRSSGSAR